MRRLAATLLAIVLFCSLVPSAAFAEPTDEDGIELAAAAVNPDYLDAPDAAASLESPVDQGHLAESLVGSARAAAVDELPAKFDLRSTGKVSSVKDQGSTGACWAFAAAASLESTILPYLPGTSLSPYHLAWFAYYGDDEQKASGDFINGPLGYGYMRGGSDNHAVAALAAWKGAVLWEDASEPDSFDESLRHQADFHLQQAYFMASSFADLGTSQDRIGRDEVKRLIRDEGAMTARYAWSGRYESPGDRSSYYCPSPDEPNHGIAIVGWDDAYARDRFAGEQPPADGAWLVKNSWGVAAGNGAPYGDGGYFWLSYYDASLRYGAVYQAGPANDYAANYQYDTVGWMSSIAVEAPGADEGGSGNGASAFAANVFTARGIEELQAVSFYTTDLNASYTVEVYTDVADAHDPRSGSLALVQSGSEAYSGYHQIALSTPVALAAGTRFSVVVKLDNPTYAYPVAVEAAISRGQGARDMGSLGLDASGRREPSFVSADGVHWRDPYGWIEDVGGTQIGVANVCVKAFANPVGTSPGTFGKPADERPLTDLAVKKEPSSWLSSGTAEQLPLASGTGDYAVRLSAFEPAARIRFDGVERAAWRVEGVEGEHELAAGTWSDEIPLAPGEERTVVLTCPQSQGGSLEYRISLARDGELAGVDRWGEFAYLLDDAQPGEEYELIAPDGTRLDLGASLAAFIPAHGQPLAELRLVRRGEDAVLQTIALDPRPAAPRMPVVDYKSETLGTVYESGVVVSTGASKNDSLAVPATYDKSVEPGSTYCLWHEATGTSFASDAVEIVLPGRPAAPDVSPRATERTRSTISFERIDGMEYRSAEGGFGASNVFRLPYAGTDYEFVVRWAADQASRKFASEDGAPFTASTLPAALPAAYSLVEEGGITQEVRDRGLWSTDWAFAALGALESNRMVQGFADDGFDLSEASLVSQTFTTRPIGADDASAGGSYAVGRDEAFGFDAEGSWRHAVSTLARWQGPVLEAQAPYLPGSLEEASLMNDAAATTNGQSSVRLESATVLPAVIEPTNEGVGLDPEGVDALKEAILAGGAAIIGARAPENDGPYTGSGVQDPAPNKAHYTYDAALQGLEANATLLVVGWDDGYSRENFAHTNEDGFVQKPSDDGAWILKACEGEDLGAGGYVWMSYAEPTLTAPVALRAEARACGSFSYGRNYQYDSVYPQTLPAFADDASFAGANVFTASGDEHLEAVGVWTTAAADVTVEVYRNLDDPANPESGERMDAAATSVALGEGYAVVPLASPVELEAGERFAVVMAQVDGTGARSVPLESSHPDNDAAPTVEAGQSFVREGGVWRDVAEGRAQGDFAFRMGSTTAGNLAVKAFTNPVSSPEPENPAVVGDVEQGKGPSAFVSTGDAVPPWAFAACAAALCAAAFAAHRGRRRLA